MGKKMEEKMSEEDYLFYKKVLKPRLKTGLLIAWCPEADKLISDGERTDEEVKEIKRKNRKA